MLAIEGVAKSYEGHAVLTDVSLLVRPGEIASLLGPNGAGKTTLLSIIAGLRSADAGSVSICGHDLATQRAFAIRNLGVAPQETAVQLSLTTRENLHFSAELAGVSRRDLKTRTAWAIEALGLGSFADRTAQKLSGGERRRLHAALAMIGWPPVVLLDEPTVGADIATRSQLLEVVRGLADQGTTIIYTTHYLPEVEELAARVMLLDHGTIIADGELQDLLEQHATNSMDLTFQGPAPHLEHHRATIVTSGSVARVTGDSIAEIAADLIGGLGADSQRLTKVEMLSGSLDSVYLSLTGRRFSHEDQPDANDVEMADDVVLNLTGPEPEVDLTGGRR